MVTMAATAAPALVALADAPLSPVAASAVPPLLLFGELVPPPKGKAIDISVHMRYGATPLKLAVRSSTIVGGGMRMYISSKIRPLLDGLHQKGSKYVASLYDQARLHVVSGEGVRVTAPGYNDWWMLQLEAVARSAARQYTTDADARVTGASVQLREMRVFHTNGKLRYECPKDTAVLIVQLARDKASEKSRGFQVVAGFMPAAGGIDGSGSGSGSGSGGGGGGGGGGAADAVARVPGREPLAEMSRVVDGNASNTRMSSAGMSKTRAGRKRKQNVRYLSHSPVGNNGGGGGARAGPTLVEKRRRTSESSALQRLAFTPVSDNVSDHVQFSMFRVNDAGVALRHGNVVFGVPTTRTQYCFMQADTRGRTLVLASDGGRPMSGSQVFLVYECAITRADTGSSTSAAVAAATTAAAPPPRVAPAIVQHAEKPTPARQRESSDKTPAAAEIPYFLPTQMAAAPHPSHSKQQQQEQQRSAAAASRASAVASAPAVARTMPAATAATLAAVAKREGGTAAVTGLRAIVRNTVLGKRTVTNVAAIAGALAHDDDAVAAVVLDGLLDGLDMCLPDRRQRWLCSLNVWQYRRCTDGSRLISAYFAVFDALPERVIAVYDMTAMCVARFRDGIDDGARHLNALLREITLLVDNPYDVGVYIATVAYALVRAHMYDMGDIQYYALQDNTALSALERASSWCDVASLGTVAALLDLPAALEELFATMLDVDRVYGRAKHTFPTLRECDLDSISNLAILARVARRTDAAGKGETMERQLYDVLFALHGNHTDELAAFVVPALARGAAFAARNAHLRNSTAQLVTNEAHQAMLRTASDYYRSQAPPPPPRKKTMAEVREHLNDNPLVRCCDDCFALSRYLTGAAASGFAMRLNLVTDASARAAHLQLRLAERGYPLDVRTETNGSYTTFVAKFDAAAAAPVNPAHGEFVKEQTALLSSLGLAMPSGIRNATHDCRAANFSKELRCWTPFLTVACIVDPPETKLWNVAIRDVLDIPYACWW